VNESLHKAIERLWRQAGYPSSRKVAERTGREVSHVTVANVLRGVGHPTWSTVAATARALGVSDTGLESLRDLWEEDWGSRTPARRHPRIKEGLVVRPGDTLVLTIDADQWSEDDIERLAEQFPDNNVTFVRDAQVAVVRKEEAA